MKFGLRAILLVLWMLLITIFIGFHFYSGISLEQYPELFRTWFKQAGVLAPLFFIILYILRPLLLIPPTIPCTAAGLLFGPWYGILLTMIGENLSSWLTYFIGKFFASELMLRLDESNSKLSRILSQMKSNDFLAVFLMRMLYLPYDPVGYLCGATKIPFKSYALGTYLGTIPGIFAFVFLGTSFTDPRFLLFFAASLLLSWIITKWTKKYNQHST